MSNIIKKFFILLVIICLSLCLIWWVPKVITPLCNGEEKEQSQKKNWFTSYKWLTDEEIDWATDKQRFTSNCFEILNSCLWHDVQQYYFQETDSEKKEKFQVFWDELIKKLSDGSKELIFIPVNKPNFHWSLLVYETKSKTFYHYDSLAGSNWNYIQDLAKNLLIHLRGDRNLDLNKCLIPNDGFKQNNTWDCGVAVIAFVKRIQENYQGDMNNIRLGHFDFKQERIGLRRKYLSD